MPFVSYATFFNMVNKIQRSINMDADTTNRMIFSSQMTAIYLRIAKL